MANSDDTILPPRRPINSGGLDGDTVLPGSTPVSGHAVGDVIHNRYTVVREIGRGGMGVVYEVLDAITGDHYAIKRLLPEYIERPDIVELFRTEGAASMRFTNKSQRFVTTQMVDLDAGIPYIVLQLIRHPTLRIVMQNAGGRLPLATALPLLHEIAAALSDLHALGYVHRDLKPENIFVDTSSSEPSIMLVDFGLSKDAGDATRTAMRGAGTERYSSPEQMRGDATSPATDVYAFGVIAYEVLTGELPRYGESLTDYVPDAPEALVSLVSGCLAGRADKRIANGSAVVQRMRDIHMTSNEAAATPKLRAADIPKKEPDEPLPPKKLPSMLRFPDLQSGSNVTVDGVAIAPGAEFVCELPTGTTKKVAVIATWEGVDLYRGAVDVRAGETKAITTRKAYRIDCDVPMWCGVNDISGQRVVFPVRGLLEDATAGVFYSLMHQRKEFDRLTLTPTVGEQVVEIRYGIGTIALADVPPGCVARINGERVNTQFSCPIRIGSTLAVSLVVVDATMVEVYTESLVLSPNESKKVTVPSHERTSVDGVSPADSKKPVEPQLAIETRASQSLLTRRLVIGGGIAGVLGGGGVLFYLRTQTPFLRYVNTMRPIPSGNFLMGSSNGDSDEQPVHNVTLSAFRMGATPVTVAVWNEYCRANNLKMPNAPVWGWIDDHPIVNVSWNDIMGADGKRGFCAWASDAVDYRLTLPTEAQFEYAALGGQSRLEFPWGNTFDDSKLWCSAETKRSCTAPVGRSSNIFNDHAYGLTDMVGNVAQWCSVRKGPYYSASETNPMGPSYSSGNARCARGGSWDFINPGSVRCANRDWYYPDIRYNYLGFRLSAGPS